MKQIKAHEIVVKNQKYTISVVSRLIQEKQKDKEGKDVVVQKLEGPMHLLMHANELMNDIFKNGILLAVYKLKFKDNRMFQRYLGNKLNEWSNDDIFGMRTMHGTEQVVSFFARQMHAAIPLFSMIHDTKTGESRFFYIYKNMTQEQIVNGVPMHSQIVLASRDTYLEILKKAFTLNSLNAVEGSIFIDENKLINE